MVNIFQNAVTQLFPKYMSCMDRGVPQGHDKNTSTGCPVFMINSTQLRLKSH